MVSFRRCNQRTSSTTSFSSYPSSDTSSTRSPSSSSTSAKGVRFSDPEDRLHPGRYASGSPKSTHKPMTETSREDLGVANRDRQRKIEESCTAIDNVLSLLFYCVKEFKWPAMLDFSACPEDPMLLANNDTNASFIGQLKSLNELRSQLAAIPTLGDEHLKEKHRAATKAMQKVFEKMREKQIELHKEYTNPTTTPELYMDQLIASLIAWSKQLEYPTELDFSRKTGNTLVYTVKNRKFMDQLYRLDLFRQELNKIPADYSERLRKQHRHASLLIGGFLQTLKKHQHDVYERQAKAYKSY